MSVSYRTCGGLKELFNISLRQALQTNIFGDNIFDLKYLEAQLACGGCKAEFQTLLSQIRMFETCDLSPCNEEGRIHAAGLHALVSVLTDAPPGKENLPCSTFC